MGNPVVHWELMSKEPQKVAAFYRKVFDWKVDHHPEINYRIVDTLAKGEMKGINGGIVKPDREGPWPGNMLFYILVDDLAAYRKKLSLFTDPEGRMMGLWKAKGHYRLIAAPRARRGKSWGSSSRHRLTPYRSALP